MNPAKHVVARYKERKKNPNGGNDIYLYSEGQVQRRNAEKAERLQALQGKIHALRAKAKKDLRSDDPSVALTALAVALIDHTYERVGSQASAKGELNQSGEKHHGVTTWTKSHVSFGRNQATIKYVGKSGVNQTKKVTDKAILTALRNAYEACDDELFCHGQGKITSKNVNDYLEEFDITAKDLRGYHANREVRKALREIRAKGKSLSGLTPDEREETLGQEFKEALEEVSEIVGHTSATLERQYLTPHLKEVYLRTGKVPKEMKITATHSIMRAKRLAQRYRHFLDETLRKTWPKS